MRLTTYGALSVAAVLMTGAQASAATIVFDDFDISQRAVDEPFPGSTSSNSVSFGAGTRTFTAENTANAGEEAAEGATTLQAVGGVLAFSNDDQATGSGTVTYTNVGDISNGSNPFFFFDIGVFDNVANFIASATDVDNNTSIYEELLTGSFSPTLFFSQFVGSADFNNLATLSFTIDTTGGVEAVDGSLDSISISAIPLPAGGLLLISGLAALAGLRRTKRS